jgi:hypothetical protein
LDVVNHHDSFVRQGLGGRQRQDVVEYLKSI